jgi:hypothetical protein
VPHLIHSLDTPTLARRALRPLLVWAIALLGLALVPAAASADGDPASDVLVSQGVFVPWDAGVPLRSEARLEAVVGAAAASGYPIRVAVIASAKDLGSVTALWHEPQTYAAYLGDELSLVFRGRVLVVMPDGVGLYPRGASGGAEDRVVVLAPRATAPRELAALATTTVERLAAGAGHVLSSSQADRPTPPAARAGAADPTPWIVFLAGLWIAAIAWWASMRARPPRFFQRRPGWRSGA